MDKETFWKVIGEVNRCVEDGDQEAVLEATQRKLMEYSAADIARWHEIKGVYMQLADRNDLWAACAATGTHCTDDGFIDFRSWLISQGKDVYMQVLQDPDSLAEVDIPGEGADFEVYGYVALAAYGQKKEVEKLEVTREIRLENITYKYPNTNVLIFDHADMNIPIGSSVGIVGTTGAGKSTIVDILLGLLQIEEGSILADGQDVREHYASWLKNVGYIPQTVFMIDDSIRKNVAFGYPEEEIDDEKVWRALEEAQLDTFVRGLPEGLDTSIGERGIRISGGQRQRISIARALFEDPEVLVLDEATSALDNETEAAIMDSINRLHGKKTLIIIAHRLQTIEKCDMVYRVEEGKISRVREAKGK